MLCYFSFSIFFLPGSGSIYGLKNPFKCILVTQTSSVFLVLCFLFQLLPELVLFVPWPLSLPKIKLERSEKSSGLSRATDAAIGYCTNLSSKVIAGSHHHFIGVKFYCFLLSHGHPVLVRIGKPFSRQRIYFFGEYNAKLIFALVHFFLVYIRLFLILCRALHLLIVCLWLGLNPCQMDGEVFNLNFFHASNKKKILVA